jgi:uncharacterized membrane protein YkvA (DUF1232 family)
MGEYKTIFSNEELRAALHGNDRKAKDILENQGKWEEFKEKFDAFLKKAAKIPILGEVIDDIITMLDLVDAYMKKEYTAVPAGTIVSIVAALIYVLSPIDLIPDTIPIIGWVDDVAVVKFLLKFGVGKDLDKFRAWKDINR